MKFTQSIRWRLLAWLAGLLGFSLLALDFAASEIHFANRVRLLDEELRRRVTMLSTAVIAPMERRDFGNPPPEPPGGFNGGPPPQNGEFDGGPPRGGVSGPPSRAPGPPPLDAAQTAAAEKQFQAEGTDGFYFAIWAEDATAPSSQSANHAAGLARPQLDEMDTGTYTRTRGGFREAFHVTEHGHCILIGHTLAPELADTRRFGGLLGLGSVVVLAFGLGGAWLIIARALRPVEKISAAAAKIASGDLAQRIPVAETESELGQLAAVLNSTFARLDAAFTRQRQFTADAAHELRTPVTVMLTHTQNGLASGCASDEHREAFEACQRAAQRMKKLIAALIALARLDDGHDTARRTKFDLAQTVRECVELIQPLAAERGVKILADLPALEILGDAEQIAQVVTNLFTNAIQYNHTDGEVRVKLERRGHQAVLAVSDTGVGISAVDLPRVFERFYRADKSRSAGGLGLGLSISKAIVTAHGGTIEVASKENAGTTFTVILQAVQS